MNREQFLDALRTALNHLYDPDYLRRSPLAAHFGVADRLETPAALQRILTSAIDSLRPSPANSQNQRFYDILLFRYVQQSTQEEVAHQLAISPRQLRREQTAAIEMLACVLSEQQPAVAADVQSAPPAAEPAVDDLAWLKEQPPDGATDLATALSGVLALLRPLAADRGIVFDLRLAEELPGVAVHRMALRQMLLGLLDAAVQQATGPITVDVSSPLQPRQVEGSDGSRLVEGSDGPRLVKGSGVPRQVEGSGVPNLFGRENQLVIEVRYAVADGAAGNALPDMAGRLAALSGGRLSPVADAASRKAVLTLPLAQSVTVLAIDDNADLLRLLERYVEGTRYRLIGCRDPLAAFDLVEREAARLIVMDAMMPDLDGWEMLGRLRAHPATADIPIVICTILDQERLAFSLGASGFLRKPVTREALLAALDAAVP